MNKVIPFLIVVIFFVLGNTAWGVCEADSNDRGECDTMYVEPWPADTLLESEGPYFVRVPIYVTNDVADTMDSIGGFTIPLCYTRSNPSKYCSLSAYWNNTNLYPYPHLERSIFRHLVISEGDTVISRMMDLAEDFSGREWDTRIIEMKSDSCWVYRPTWPPNGQDSAFVPPHFWLNLFPTGSEDQFWWEGSKVLLATMTFKVEDSMQICIDTCLWPPLSRLAWTVLDSNGYGVSKIPRLGSPHDPASYKVCFNLRKPVDVREIRDSEDSRPSEFSLSQNYPNPFNPTTSFQFSLCKSAHVKIEIFNIVGQKVRILVDEDMKPGFYVADWDGKDENQNPVSSGIYFYRMQAGEFADMKKMLLLK